MTGRWTEVVRNVGRVVAIGALVLAVACSSDDSQADAGGERDSAAVAPGYAHDGELRMNDVQAMGTHNSYHLAPQPEFADALDEVLPGLTSEWLYGQDPLPVQLADQGVRQLELDVWFDPDGRYAQRKAQGFAGLPLQPHPELAEPGIKVLHVMEVDPESTCLAFVTCMNELEEWSSANPGHAPVLVLVEAKADAVPDVLDLGFVEPIPWGSAELDQIDDEIRSVFDDDQLITPDLVRGDAASLEEAVLTTGWPTLDVARGRVMFALDNPDEVMEAYQEGHPSLEGRVMFTGGDEPGTPETAFIKLNNSIKESDTIREVVEAGYIVRTTGDKGNTPEGREAYDKREAALTSGAQYISTDYPVPDPAIDPDFEVRIPDGTPMRCNPIIAPAWCTSADVESPERLAP